jgi:hypothetical protein
LKQVAEAELTVRTVTASPDVPETSEIYSMLPLVPTPGTLTPVAEVRQICLSVARTAAEVVVLVRVTVCAKAGRERSRTARRPTHAKVLFFIGFGC